MRKIKFRGKDIESGKWLFGSLVTHRGDTAFIADGFIQSQVEPQTVGEFTGLQDAGGKDIYEGDIVLLKIDGGCSVVEFSIGSFVVFEDTELFEVSPQCQVIGNIHDNPDLLKEGD